MESFLQQTNTENLKNLLSSAECTIGSVPLCPGSKLSSFSSYNLTLSTCFAQIFNTTEAPTQVTYHTKTH